MVTRIVLVFFAGGCAAGLLPSRWQRVLSAIVGLNVLFRWLFAFDDLISNFVAWVVTFAAAGFYVGMLSTFLLKKLFRQRTDVLPKYWTQEDADDLEKVTTFKEIRIIMLRVLSRMPDPVGMVIGPITTGGLGCVEKNMKVFAMHIANLEREQKNIFSQLPFEPAIWRVRALISGKDPSAFEIEAVNAQLIQDIYFEIFESGKISIVYRIPNWFSSFGSRMEDEKVFELGIDRDDLDDD